MNDEETTLAPVIVEAMRRCNNDRSRLMGPVGVCAVCPLLDACVSQERAEKQKGGMT